MTEAFAQRCGRYEKSKTWLTGISLAMFSVWRVSRITSAIRWRRLGRPGFLPFDDSHRFLKSSLHRSILESAARPI